MSPQAYLMQERLRIVKDLLKQGDDTIENIAEQIGMSPLTLQRNFKKIYQVTPGQYRKGTSKKLL